MACLPGRIDRRRTWKPAHHQNSPVCVFCCRVRTRQSSRSCILQTKRRLRFAQCLPRRSHCSWRSGGALVLQSYSLTILSIALSMNTPSAEVCFTLHVSCFHVVYILCVDAISLLIGYSLTRSCTNSFGMTLLQTTTLSSPEDGSMLTPTMLGYTNCQPLGHGSTI